MNYNYTSNPSPTRDLTILALLNSGKTLKAIGDEFGLTRERVRQITTARGTKSAEAVRRFSQSGVAKAKAAAVSVLVNRDSLTINGACQEVGTHGSKVAPLIADGIKQKSRDNLMRRNMQRKIHWCETLRPLVMLDGLTLAAAGRSIGLGHGHANFIARELAPELVIESKRILAENAGARSKAFWNAKRISK